jgi:hypothetical protein
MDVGERSLHSVEEWIKPQAKECVQKPANQLLRMPKEVFYAPVCQVLSRLYDRYETVIQNGNHIVRSRKILSVN